ncbi:MAG: family 43 glycosylhydrolase, partial [Clostridia bacterium]|nr:family 43 glycosylhydrolase [Clostridia bacterium]
TLSLARARNLGDLKYAEKKVIYSPASGHPWSMHQWSPEIHYYTDEQVGAGNGGWYCYIAPCSENEYHEGEQNHRMYVIKCLDGDNLLGRWGNPVTGAVNVPERVVAPDIPDWEETWAGGQSSIIINGKAYTLFIAMSKERVSNKNGTNSHYQYICIAPLTNPWTIKGQPTMICKPDYDWEMVGSESGAARVVEGSTAVYGKDGSVYIIYSGSGYWTTEYQLGQLKYTGGDPMDAKNWEKKPTSIFRQNNVLTGSGHASYVTDAFGQGWICYHAYVGDPKLPSNSKTYEYGGGRLAFVEPYYADKNGVVIADGAGRPADMDMVYVTKLDPTPLAERISGFDSIDNSYSFCDILNVIRDKIAGIKEVSNEEIKNMIKRVTER